MLRFGGVSLTLLAIGTAPMPPSVPSALQKLQAMAMSLQQANAVVTSLSRIEVVDNLYGGNINVFQQVGDKMVRITLDPTRQRVISAGYVQARNVANSIASGRVIPR